MAEQDNRGNVQKLFDRLSLSWKLIGDRRVDMFHKLIPLAAVLYVLSPIDFIPEVVLGPLGVFDDIGMLLVGLEAFIRMAPNDVVREHLNNLKAKFNEGQNNINVVDAEFKVHDK